MYSWKFLVVRLDADPEGHTRDVAGVDRLGHSAGTAGRRDWAEEEARLHRPNSGLLLGIISIGIHAANAIQITINHIKGVIECGIGATSLGLPQTSVPPPRFECTLFTRVTFAKSFAMARSI